MLFLENNHPLLSDYFDNITVVLTPDNRVLVSKRPHKPFHKYISSDPRRPLASHPDCKTSKKIIKTPQLNMTIPPLPTPKQFTRAGRQTILSCAGALEKHGYKPEQFWFFTGTLPGSSDSACESFSRYSRYALNRLKQSLRSKGLDLTFNTWEWQLRESVRSRKGLVSLPPALHLHLVIATPSVVSPLSDYSWLPDFLKEKWFDILDDISKLYKSPYQVHSKVGGGHYNRKSISVQKNCCKTIQCEKSPAAYLSKYVGKISSKASFDIKKHCKKEQLNLYYPSSWWSVSNALRKMANDLTYTFTMRVSSNISEEIFEDLTSFIAANATISLPKYSPEFYPEYFYQSSYIPSQEYQFIRNSLDIKINYISSQHGVRELASLPFSPSLDDTILRWFIKIPGNSFYRDGFIKSLPFYYKNIEWDDKHPCWDSAWLRHLLRKYYDTNVSSLKDFLVPNV